LGAFTAPIYEVYKVGIEKPTWREGLNVLASFGLNCVVIPHFDNSEGGNYDTRFCYLGEPRLKELEAQLPDGVATLGVDEHTAAILDFNEDSLTVKGRSNVHWRLAGTSRVLENGTTTSLNELRTLSLSARPPSTSTDSIAMTSAPTVLATAATQGGEEGLRALAQLVQLAETGGRGFIDPRDLVDGVLGVRATARASGRYDLADMLRDALIKARIDVKDGPDGTTWSLIDN
jgi:hypothetical protein